MTKLLHTRSKIFFPNPLVVRMEYSHDIPLDMAETDYRNVMRNAYKLIHGTWGYSKLEYEPAHPALPGPASLNGMNHHPALASLFTPAWAQVSRGYICFKDEIDALQFRLSIDARAIQVKMWPARWFTIHEVVETDES